MRFPSTKGSSEIWSFSTGHIVWPSPVIGPNGYIYAGTDNSKIYVMDAVTGTKINEIEIPEIEEEISRKINEKNENVNI